ncbi:MAG: hypothetical protein JWM71_188 [Solirubrobacteraceae bacterium]|nr:hypothetical protein [Solirubrobacteraceae bacterium]
MRSLRHGAVLAGALAVGMFPAAAIAAPASHGQFVHPLKFDANQSNNWFGYNAGTLERNDTLFNSITGDWTVPTATAHTAGQAESSSDWVGIGGGCADAGCTVSDSTLIQTGTEQDVDATGKASYSSWWELVPAPSIDTGMSISPGDHMHASVAETVPDSDVWVITLQDVTKGESFSQTVPYPSTHLTAEWIEETPLLIGTDAGLASLPNLSNPAFTSATVNGANAGLKASEEMQLTDSSGNVIGSPSAPNSTGNGFSACSWATTC